MDKERSLLKVVHVSTHDIKGGAARAAYRLHSGLRSIGVDSSMVVMLKSSSDPTVGQYNCGGMRYQTQRYFANRKARRDQLTYSRLTSGEIESFSTDDGTGGRHLAEQLGTADIINLHWIGGFVNYRSFFGHLSPRPRIVWTLHDMNPFTGGCHYSAGCVRFQQRCGCCPILNSPIENDLSREVIEEKNSAFIGINTARMHVVAPSNWLHEQANRSWILGRYQGSVIPYGLATERFKPIDRASCRAVLGISMEARVVLFVAESIGNERKGLALLLKAISQIAGLEHLLLLSLGASEKIDIGGVAHRPLGALTNDNFLAAVYGAADVFVIPSLEDNLPNTLLEAIACGVPAVGFRVGGVPDVIREGVTGTLAERGSVESLADKIKLLLSDEDLRLKLAVNCRKVAVEEYSLGLQASRYQSLYNQLLLNQSIQRM